MNDFRVVMGAVNLAVYLVLATGAVVAARRRRSPLFSRVLLFLAAVSGVFILGSVQRLLIQSVRSGILPDTVQTWLTSNGQLVLSLYALVVVAVGALLVPGLIAELAGTERIVGVMSDGPIRTSVSEMRLTARELNVIEAILGGALTDREIADALYIAPATAATHVRNVMKKAGVSSRRDLLFVEPDPRIGNDADRQ